MRLGFTAHRGTDPEREHDRPDSRRSHPPHRGDAVRVPERRRADCRSGADIRREHRRKQQAGAETPARDKEIAGSAHASPDPESKGHQRQRVADENDEIKSHFKSRRARKPGTPVAWRAARTMASAMTSAASAPT